MNLLEQLSAQGQTKHYSPRTVVCYRGWVEQFLRFIRARDGRWIHPKDLGAADVEAFLTHLAVKRRSAASTQNQALNAIVFLYRDVLKMELGDFSAVRSTRPARLPTVLSREEVPRLLAALERPAVGAREAARLMVSLLYGAGLRAKRGTTAAELAQRVMCHTLRRENRRRTLQVLLVLVLLLVLFFLILILILLLFLPAAREGARARGGVRRRL